MRAILGGLMYDTEKALSIGRAGGTTRKGSWTEELFRTPRQNFFLLGFSGRWKRGGELGALTQEAAMEWAVKHLSMEEADKWFGPFEEA